MAEVTGIIGNEQVELNNAATEETAKKLLAAMKVLNQSILKLTPPSGGGTTGGAAAADEGLQSLAKGGVGLAAKGFSILSGIVGSIAGVFGSLVGSIVNVGSNLIGFAGGLMEGQGGLSGFYKALEALPGPLGWVAGLFAKIAEMQEAELAVYRNISQSGANFGGQLSTLRSNALGLGLTLDEFSDVIKKNSSTFALMGGTVNEGAVAFTKIARQFRESDLGAQLRGLGYTSIEATQGLADYIAITGGRTSAEMKSVASQKALQASAGNYLEELDRLAAITGKNRQEQEDEIKKLALQPAWENYIAKLRLVDPKQAEKLTTGLAEAGTAGKLSAQNFQTLAMGMPPLVEANATAMGMSKNTTQGLMGLVRTAKDSTKNLDDMSKSGANLRHSQVKDAEMYGKNLAVLSMQGKEYAEISNDMLKQQTKSLDNNLHSLKDYEKQVDTATAAQKIRETSAAFRMAETEKGFKDMGAAIYGALAPAINTISPIITGLADKFMKFTSDSGVLEKLKVGLQFVAEKFSEFVQNMFTPEGRDKIVNDLSYYLKLLMLEIKRAIYPEWMYDDEDKARDTAKIDAEKALADKKAELARMDKSTDAKLVEKKKQEIEQLSKKIAAKDYSDYYIKPNTPTAAPTENRAAPVDQTYFKQGIGESPEDFAKRMKSYADRENAKKEKPAKPDESWKSNYMKQISPDQGRATGSLGMTGNLFENFGKGTPMMLHGQEAIVTPAQMSEIMAKALKMGQQGNTEQLKDAIAKADQRISKDTVESTTTTPTVVANTNENILADQLQRLNSISTEMLKHMKETAEQSRKNVEATKSLNRNIWA